MALLLPRPVVCLGVVVLLRSVVCLSAGCMDLARPTDPEGHTDQDLMDLGPADLEGPTDLEGRDLEGRDLEGRDLEGRDLEGRDLEGLMDPVGRTGPGRVGGRRSG